MSPPPLKHLRSSFGLIFIFINHSDAPLYKFLANRHFVNVGNINPTGGERGSFAILEAKAEIN